MPQEAIYERQRLIEGLEIPEVASVVGCGGTGFRNLGGSGGAPGFKGFFSLSSIELFRKVTGAQEHRSQVTT